MRLTIRAANMIAQQCFAAKSCLFKKGDRSLLVRGHPCSQFDRAVSDRPFNARLEQLSPYAFAAPLRQNQQSHLCNMRRPAERIADNRSGRDNISICYGDQAVYKSTSDPVAPSGENLWLAEVSIEKQEIV